MLVQLKEWIEYSKNENNKAGKRRIKHKEIYTFNIKELIIEDKEVKINESST